MITEQNTKNTIEDKSIKDSIKKDLLKGKKEASPGKSESHKNEIRFNVSKLNDSDFKKMLIYYDSLSMSPTEYLLTGMITALSGVIGKKAYFKFTDHFYLFLNVWAVIIGHSTITKKTTSLNIVLQDIERINQEKYNVYKSKLDMYNIEKDINKNSIEPKREYIKFPDDSTIESLTTILENQQRGILKASEFGGFLKRLNKGYAGDIKETLTELYDVPLSYEITRMSRENVLLERPFLSILGASTIEWFRENINQSDLRAGFLARFLYSIRNSNEKPYIPFLELEDIIPLSENYFDTGKIYNRLTSIEEIIINHSKEAKGKHINYDRDSYKELSQSDGEEISFKARLLGYSFKIAGIIALTNGRDKIEVQDVEDSILITEYYKKNVGELLSEQLVYSEFQIKENRIFNIIKKSKGKDMKRTDLFNRSNMDKKEFDLIIDTLLEKEKISFYTKETASKPAKHYKLKEIE